MKKYFLFILAIPVLLSSCHYMWGKRVRGDGNIKTEERSVTSFKQVEVSGAMKVHILQGEFKPVKIEGDENLLKYVEIAQEGDRLEIRPKKGYNLAETSKSISQLLFTVKLKYLAHVTLLEI